MVSSLDELLGGDIRAGSFIFNCIPSQASKREFKERLTWAMNRSKWRKLEDHDLNASYSKRWR
jgi:hypothetical protein